MATVTTAAFRSISRLYSSLSTEAVPLSPAVRFIVDTNNLDALRIKGTGPKGRILKGDVLAVVQQPQSKQQQQQEQQQPSGGLPLNGFGNVPGLTQSPATTTSSSSSSASSPGTDTPSGPVDEPLTNMRRTIAKRLTHAKNTIPHAYTSIQCRADEMITLRKRFKEDGVKVSLNDIIVKVVAHTLKKVPEVNSTWDESTYQVRLSPSVDISVAVATPSGLITPIIQNADSKTISAISEEFKDLAGRAKLGKLQPEEFTGGSFTLSNLGMFGIKQFTAIINSPQTAILAVGGMATQLVEMEHGIEMAPFVTLTLSRNSAAISEELSCHWLEECKQVFEYPLVCV